MSIFAKMMGLNPETYYEEAERLYKDERYGEAKIEYEKALELFPKDDEKLVEIKEKIDNCRRQLSLMHEKWADSCVESSVYEKGIEEYQLSLELLPESDEHYSEIKKKLADTKRTYLRNKALAESQPYIERGEEFLKEGHYNGALVEFREALNILKFLSSKEEKKEEVIKYLTETEEHVAQPYIERGESLLATNLYDEAIDEFEKARLLMTCNEKLLTKLDKLVKSAIHKRGKDVQTEDNETFISKQEWDKALGDYSKLLEKYFNYTYEDSDPYKAYHMNKFEKEFKEAKHLVGTLYVKRADGYLNMNKPAVALKYYAEAINFFDEKESEYKYVEEKINECKEKV